jgi:membrane-associated phospholipid phosphatase
MKSNTNYKDFIKVDISQKKLIAIFATSLLFYITAIILWKQNTLDCSIVLHFNYVYENDAILRFFNMLSHYGMPFITALYVLFLFLSFKKDDLKNELPLFYLILISFVIAGIAGDLLKEIFDKSRPVIVLSGQITIKSFHETPGFPSGHATKSMALALPFILMASRKSNLIFVFKTLLFIASISVCYSRIAQQAHFLSDVLAGFGTALFFLPIAIWLTNKLYEKGNINKSAMNQFSKKAIFIFLALTFFLF